MKERILCFRTRSLSPARAGLGILCLYALLRISAFFHPWPRKQALSVQRCGYFFTPSGVHRHEIRPRFACNVPSRLGCISCLSCRLASPGVNNTTDVQLTLSPDSFTGILPNTWVSATAVAKATHPVAAPSNHYHDALSIHGPTWGAWQYTVMYSATGEAGSYQPAVKGTYSLKITFGRSTLNANDHSGFDTTAATVAFVSAKTGYWQIDIGRGVEYDDKQAGQKEGAYATWKGSASGQVASQVCQEQITTAEVTANADPTNQVGQEQTTTAQVATKAANALAAVALPPKIVGPEVVALQPKIVGPGVVPGFSRFNFVVDLPWIAKDQLKFNWSSSDESAAIVGRQFVVQNGTTDLRAYPNNSIRPYMMKAKAIWSIAM